MHGRSAPTSDSVFRPDNARGRLVTYRAALPIGVLAMVLPLLFLSTHLMAFDVVAQPLLAVLLTVLAILVWTRVPVGVVDHVLVVSANLYVVSRLGYTLAAPDLPARAAVLGSSVPWVVVLLLMNDWLLRSKAARQLNVAVLFTMALCVLAWWPAAQPGDEQRALVSMLIQLLLACATLIVVQVFTARHVADLGRHARQAIREANLDTLTGLPNRRALNQHLDGQAAQPGGILAVALIDVDHFKAVNDRHGHSRGDEVLRAVAQALRGQLGTRGLVGRFGGEEFLCIMTVPDEGAARVVCEELRGRVSALPLAGVPITVSVGLAVGGRPLHSLHLLESADAALYRAKALGRDQVQLTVLLRSLQDSAALGSPTPPDARPGDGQYA